MADGTVKCIDDEIPFEIPASWEWRRLSTVCSYLHRGKSPKYGMVKELPIIAQKCNQWDKLYIDRCQYSDIDFIAKYSDDQFVQLHDILINSTGGGTVGRTGFVDDSIFELYSRFVADSHVTVVRPFASVSPRYIYFYLISPYIQVGLEDRCSGSTNQIELGTSTIGNYLLPLPPYNEQERIISIVNDTLPKVVIYGNSQEKLNSLNQQIRLSLKKSILQEAIQGKLVPQDPNDEPASVLLERIRAEKERLIKEKKIKRDKNESIIYKGDDNSYCEKLSDGSVICIDEEIPFEIPNGWEWSRVRSISESYIGLTYKPTDISEYGTIVLRSSNIKNGKMTYDDIVRVKCQISERLLVHENDILICARNGSKKLVGKSALIKENNELMTFGAFMCICKSSLYEYLFMYLQSELFYSQLREVSGTTTINQLTQNSFNSFLVPIPPFAEQNRILHKLRELEYNL
jgi:type I restriction enzyme S subunit